MRGKSAPSASPYLYQIAHSDRQWISGKTKDGRVARKQEFEGDRCQVGCSLRPGSIALSVWNRFTLKMQICSIVNFTVSRVFIRGWSTLRLLNIEMSWPV